MPRPQIIRADTLDLQTQDAPSAKDHSRQPQNPAPLGDGPPAPHQAIALKNAGLDGLELHSRSPRASQDLSNKELQLLPQASLAEDDDDADGEGHVRNGDGTGADGEDGRGGDGDADDGLDDDMMDKISSSPSIEDGGYSISSTVVENSPLSNTLFAMHGRPASPVPELSSSSPYLETPEHFPLLSAQQQLRSSLSEGHHQHGGYSEDERDNRDSVASFASESRDQLTPLISETRTSYFVENIQDMDESYDTDYDSDDLEALLLPIDDTLLDNSFDDLPRKNSGSPSGSSRSSESPTPSIWDDRTLDKNDDDDTHDISFTDPRFVDSGWGGECLREVEDINFEFVYALHTFVATVEGQANAAKGDTMVLLDDSNSYWWLVRVVKDSSIGYLPAEHIETPTERLARLNKHRNVDLSQTMLGDNPEKTKNPLKKAMRRRNAKTVQFTAPTYYDPSDREYSSEEEEGEEGEEGNYIQGSEVQQDQDQQVEEIQEEIAAVEPLRVKSPPKEEVDKSDTWTETMSQQSTLGRTSQDEKPRTSEETFERQEDGTVSKSRKGTVRNTDSFFKDDTVETRKINLTPSLLRDDFTSSTPASGDNKENKPRGSFDTDKSTSSGEKSKDDKRKDKKPGMLSGLFKRKDRKSKSQSDDEDPEWLAKEIAGQATPPKVSSESMSQDGASAPSSPQRQQPQRQTSKLQKAPPQSKGLLSPKRPSSREGQNNQKSLATEQTRVAPSATKSERSAAPTLSAEPPNETEITNPAANAPLRASTPDRPREQDQRPLSPNSFKRSNMFSPIRDALRSGPSTSDAKPEKVKKARERMKIDDDSDSSTDATRPAANPIHQAFSSTPSPDNPRETESQPAITSAPHYPEPILHLEPVTQHDNPNPQPHTPPPLDPPPDRLSESPIQVSPIIPTTHPTLVASPSPPSSRAPSPLSSSSTPELINHPPDSDSLLDPPTTTSKPSPSQPPTQQTPHLPEWSPAHLRTYLEDDSDIRDLLVVVHDRSQLLPAGPDHHVVRNLCREERGRLEGMGVRLDGLLSEFLRRKREGAVG